MPALEIDVKSIPDIIEAQLTLSYSRLSDLIRVLVEQGNAHDDELGELRSRIDALEGQNADLRAELVASKPQKDEEAAAEMQHALDEMREELRRMNQQIETNRLAAESGSELTNAKLLTATSKHEQETKQLQNGVGQLNADFSGLKESHEIVRAFYDLWGAEDVSVSNMASKNGANPDGLENHPEDRVNFLHTLLPFSNLKDEMDGLRTLLQRVSTDNLTRAATAGEENPRASLGGGAEVAALEERVHVVEQQLKDLGVEASAGLSMARRLACLEEAMDGTILPPGGSARGVSAVSQSALVPAEVGVAPMNPAPRQPPQAPICVADFLKSSSTSRTTSVQPSAGASQASNPARAAGRTSLPPIGSAAGEETAALHTPGGIYGASSSMPNANPSRISRPSIAMLTLDQPHVELLREGSEDDGAGSAAATGVPRVSILFPEEGIRRRVEQLEEDTAMLELKKADRSEVAILEEALRQLLIQTATSRGPGMMEQDQTGGYPNLPYPPGATVSPGRPMFINGGQSINLRSGNRRTNATISPSGGSPAHRRD